MARADLAGPLRGAQRLRDRREARGRHEFRQGAADLPAAGGPAGALGHYAEYYQGLAELRLGRAADARQTFQALAAKKPTGYLLEAAALREAECDETLNDQGAAMQV